MEKKPIKTGAGQDVQLKSGSTQGCSSKKLSARNTFSPKLEKVKITKAFSPNLLNRGNRKGSDLGCTSALSCNITDLLFLRIGRGGGIGRRARFRF